MSSIEGRSAWADATLAAALLAVDAAGLGGAAVRAPSGPVRQAWLDLLRALMPASAPFRRMPVNTSVDRLLGGLDLAATLAAGRLLAAQGLLVEADGGLVVIPMAERLPAVTAAHLSATLDTGVVRIERDGLTRATSTRIAVIALDEGEGTDERPPAGLLDRLSILLDLSDVAPGTVAELSVDTGDLASAASAARAQLPRVSVEGGIVEALCAAAASLGIDSPRACLFALRVARAHAALMGCDEVTEDDANVAARFVFAMRASTLPAGAPERAAEQQPEPQSEPQSGQQPGPEALPREDPDASNTQGAVMDQPADERIVQAVVAALPAGLLAQLKLGEKRRSSSRGKAGALQGGGARGRPAGTRRARTHTRERLNLVATLRAAVPWQPLRRRDRRNATNPSGPAGTGQRLEIRRDDFRITHHVQRSQTTTIFLVDASGSSALHRLAEAKGAVELLLADCYIRRDQVALIAFRGTSAELLLPPTRSLTRAKRSLAALPGGGATPLAAGIDAAFDLALAVRRSGAAPVVVLITDGRANICRQGSPGRAQAEADALLAARRFRGESLAAVLIDSSARTQALAQQLASEMGARYLPLPYADAGVLNRAIQAASRVD